MKMYNRLQKSMHNLCFVYLLTAILSTKIVDAIQCYQCTSVNDTRCLDLKHDNSTLDLYRECNGDYHGKQPFCRKTVQTIIDEVRIVRVHRSCGWEEDEINTKPCYKYENDFHLEVICVCLTDGCNAAPPSLTPMALLVAAATAGTMMFRR
ncbi:uncharacterized protein CBL_09154 [Carabus blaptoides fortunei]